MRLNDLDLNLLIYLDALLDERSVSRAAKRVFITQPSMSDALARLRGYFQDDLLVQVGKKMVPTAVAESLVQPVRDILLQIQTVVSSRCNFDPGESNRRITIMAADYTSDVLLNPVAGLVAREAPGMRFEYLAFTSLFQEEFNRGNLDLLIMPEQYKPKEHPSEVLYTDTFVCVIWSGNELVGDSISLQQYCRMGHVSVNVGEWRVHTHEEESFLKRYGNARRVEVSVPSFRMAIQQIPGTNRILTCHLRHARMYQKLYSLRLLKPPFVIPPFRQCISWHKYKDRDPALAWYRRILKTAAAEMKPPSPQRRARRASQLQLSGGA